MQRGLRIIGVLGILDDAATLGMVNLSDALSQLQQTNFRISPSLIQTPLEQHSASEEQT